MSITLSAAFIRQLKKKGKNTPNVLMEIDLDAGTEILSYYGPNAGDTGALPSNTKAVIKNVTSHQSKLSKTTGWASRGEISFQIIGRKNFRLLVKNNFLKNRRVVKKEGFIGDGFLYSEYAETFWGKVSNWTRKGDVLTVYVRDDLADTTKKIPAMNATKTQSLSYANGGLGTNAVDIMTNLLITQAGIDSAYVDSTKFNSERDTWLPAWRFFRVLTDPTDVKDYLNELQTETNSFITQDGQKISYKVFAPPLPGETVELWTDDNAIIKNSLSCSSGYVESFFNAVVVLYNYNESGSNGDEDYETVELLGDADSQSSAQWDEEKTKYIKCKWIRTIAFDPPASTPILGLVAYHISSHNGIGSGELYFTYNEGSDDTLKWKEPGAASFGEEVKITKDGKYQVFGLDPLKYIRVVVDFTTFTTMSANNSDVYTITSLDGENYAKTIGGRFLSRYRDPSSSITFEVDLNSVGFDSGGGYTFLSIADLKDITTDDAFEKGDESWVSERVMITSIRPDFKSSKVRVEAIETKMYHKTGFIAPNGFPDYGSATEAQRRYGYIGRNYIW